MAYFTDPMSDEFKKAIEEAMREIEADELAKRRPKDFQKVEKLKTDRLSGKMKRALK